MQSDLRTSPGFQDKLMTYLLPPDGRKPEGVYPTDTICSQSQSHREQSAESRRLTIRNGETVMLQYNENGHITKPWNNGYGKTDAGTVFVYSTNDSLQSDAVQRIHKVWTADGTGGDRRGRLLYRGDFDDGRCYQYTTASSGFSAIANARAKKFPGPGSNDTEQGQNLWCVADVTVPSMEIGSEYSLYWVWDWPSSIADGLSHVTVVPQVYTTCMDIRVIA